MSAVAGSGRTVKCVASAAAILSDEPHATKHREFLSGQQGDADRAHVPNPRRVIGASDARPAPLAIQREEALKLGLPGVGQKRGRAIVVTCRQMRLQSRGGGPVPKRRFRQAC